MKMAFPTARVDSEDSRLDMRTGTLRCRAVVSNPDGILLPGLFARVRLIAAHRTRPCWSQMTPWSSKSAQAYLYIVNDRGVIEPVT